ncbi:kinetochore protein NDC80 homolog [Lineus longissimus]|uniref:kinetochore protein NDC80 homolog n=1 Tax=Lineus longissimus TaxID=88925 RepID=UPI002B4C91D3
MRRSRSSGGGGGRPSLASRVIKSNLPVSQNNARSSSGGRYSTDNRYSVGSQRSSSVGRSAGNNQQNKQKSSQAGIIGKPRTSGYGRIFGNDTMKDPRPLFDKSSGYRDRCIKRLIEFLQMKHYPHKISTRILHSPATKEVIHIFEFLYGYIQPGYVMKNKHEEEIPRLMKMIEYPFNLTKNMMFTIGAPHTWPCVLGALIWLVEYIEGAMNTDIEAVMFPNEADEFEAESEPEKLILYNYLAKSYSMYMAGADSFTEVEEELLNSLKMRYAGSGGSVDQLAETNRRLMAELDELQKEPDRLASVQEYHYNISRDFSKFKDYLEKMEMVKVNLSKKMAENQEELNNAELEVQRLVQDVKHKRHILDTQTISQIDVQRINRGSQELRRQNEALQREISENEKQIWTFEMGMGKRQEKIEEQCQNHRQLLMKLKMILPADAYINTDDLKCEPSSDNLNIVKERIMKNVALSQTKSHETLAQLHHEMELLELVKETEEEKQNLLEDLERRLESLSKEIDVNKETFIKEENQLKGEVTKRQKVNNELRQDLYHSSVAEVADQLIECQARNDRLVDEARQEKMEWITFLEAAIMEVVTHKELLQKTFHDFKGEFEKLHTEEKLNYEQEKGCDK